MVIKDERMTIKSLFYTIEGKVYWRDLYIIKTCEVDGFLFGFANLIGPESDVIEQLVEISTGALAVTPQDEVKCKQVPMSWLCCYREKVKKSGLTTAQLIDRYINRFDLITQLWQVNLWCGLYV